VFESKIEAATINEKIAIDNNGIIILAIVC
jgi:hypothetical protein